MSAHTDKLYERVMNVVGESQRMVDVPHVPDMEHIKQEVEALVAEINKLPIEEKATYAEKFKELFDALSKLEADLKAKRDQVEAMISDTGQHKKATNAYTKTSHIDNKGE